MNNEFVLTKSPSGHQQLEVPEASVGRIWEEELSYIGKKKQMTGWKIGLWSSFCSTLW